MWLLLLLLASSGRAEDCLDCDEEGWWAEVVRSTQRYFSSCRRRTGVFNSLDEDLVVSVVRLKNCFKENFLQSLDAALLEKELPLTSFLTLIKEDNAMEDSRSKAFDEDLIASIYWRFSRLLDTHSFKFNFSQLWASTASGEYEDNEVESSGDEEKETSRSMEVQARQRFRRRRQQYRKAFPMMVAGYMMMSAFLVPLGFQFMAMIGGKALLLAKMAFFMSLFSGYKRLTNDIEYHHHPPHGHHHDFHDFHHHYPAFHHRSSHEAMPSMSQGLQGLLAQMPGAAAFSQLGNSFGQTTGR